MATRRPAPRPLKRTAPFTAEENAAMFERTFTLVEVAQLLETHFAVADVRICAPGLAKTEIAVAHVTLENAQQFYVTIEPGRS